MAKKKVVTSNIQTNHTLGEYQRYFSHLLMKGKLHRYELNEKNKLASNRQYWMLTDEKGKTYYYELPKYIKPGDTRSAYSLRRVTHRRPTRIALAIFAGTAIVSFTSAIVTRRVFTPHFPDIPPQPIDLEGLQKKLHDFQVWQEDNPSGDATNEFTISDLASIAVANALYNPNSYHEEGDVGGYDRRLLLTVGFGHTITQALGFIDVYVDITNSFTYDGVDALEESISYSGDIMAPKVGKRDFYYKNEDKVKAHVGEAKSKIDANWAAELEKEFAKDSYIDEVGKYPDNPFLYSISEETVLNDSSATKTNNGYEIVMNLDTIKGVAGYVKRMTYLSGKTVEKFKKVELTFVTDNNLQLLSSKVNESYDIHDDFLGPLPTTGVLETKFYYENVPSIPEDVTTPFDYRPYQAE